MVVGHFLVFLVNADYVLIRLCSLLQVIAYIIKDTGFINKVIGCVTKLGRLQLLDPVLLAVSPVE